MRVAAVFSNDMVLQREKRIAVWGEATNDEPISVQFGGHTVSTVAVDGKWQVFLPPMAATTNLQMVVTGAQDTVTFSNVAVGEVWLCGGQSNMEFEIHSEKNGEALLQSLTPDCGVRFYYTPKQSIKDEHFDATERNTCWSEATPESARAWSAVGLYFALRIAKELGITVGLIGCNWGGTSATAWIPRSTIEQHTALLPYLVEYDKAMEGKTLEEHIKEYDEYIVYQDAWNVRCGQCYADEPGCSWERVLEVCGESKFPGPMGPKNEYRPGGIYETMLQRVCPYTLRGFLYYQGESDDHRPDTYEELLTALVHQWRDDWNDENLYFLNVQLPMFKYAYDPDYQHWCKIREAQANVYHDLRNTGLAVLTDCGELDNIHPTDKEPVGERLALQALYMVYHRVRETEACAPMYHDSYTMGNTMVLHINHAAEGFLLKGEPIGFEIAGADGVYHRARAVLTANCIILTADAVPSPLYARYAWSNYMIPTVFGANGLPLAPFRTDKAH